MCILQAGAALREVPLVPKKLRVYLFATHTNQPPAAAAGAKPGAGGASAAAAAAPASPAAGGKKAKAAAAPDGGPPAWALHVHGRLLEPGGEVPGRGLPPAPQAFSHYLRGVAIALGPPGGPAAEALAWRAAQHTEPAREAFEVR